MSYPVFRAPGAPVDPNSSAAKIAATVGTAEAPQDWRLRNGSPAEHRRNELTAALRERGLGHHVDASALQRVLQHAPGGDAAEVADMIVERYPSWFVPAPKPTASELVRRFQAGETVQPRI